MDEVNGSQYGVGRESNGLENRRGVQGHKAVDQFQGRQYQIGCDSDGLENSGGREVREIEDNPQGPHDDIRGKPNQIEDSGRFLGQHVEDDVQGLHDDRARKADGLQDGGRGLRHQFKDRAQGGQNRRCPVSHKLEDAGRVLCRQAVDDLKGQRDVHRGVFLIEEELGRLLGQEAELRQQDLRHLHRREASYREGVGADDRMVVDEDLDGHAPRSLECKRLSAEGKACHVNAHMERTRRPVNRLPDGVIGRLTVIVEVDTLRRPCGVGQGGHEDHGVVLNYPHLNCEEVEKRGVGLGHVDGTLSARHQGRAEVEGDLGSRCDHWLHDRGEQQEGENHHDRDKPRRHAPRTRTVLPGLGRGRLRRAGGTTVRRILRQSPGVFRPHLDLALEACSVKILHYKQIS